MLMPMRSLMKFASQILKSYHKEQNKSRKAATPSLLSGSSLVRPPPTLSSLTELSTNQTVSPSSSSSIGPHHPTPHMDVKQNHEYTRASASPSVHTQNHFSPFHLGIVEMDTEEKSSAESKCVELDESLEKDTYIHIHTHRRTYKH